MTPTTETTLSFNGDWSLPVVLIVATVLAGLMLLLYRREILLVPDRLAWLPAILRSLAVFLLVLALSGPVLRHVTTQRQLGRVIIGLDEAER